MIIDASHPEQTRVVMVRGNRVDEFDFESEHKTQLRGNIYLAKVTRVEPSLQAAFVDYGGNRHGFLAFSEIHPDYYQIPIADRQAILTEERTDLTIEICSDKPPVLEKDESDDLRTIAESRHSTDVISKYKNNTLSSNNGAKNQSEEKEISSPEIEARNQITIRDIKTNPWSISEKSSHKEEDLEDNIEELEPEDIVEKTPFSSSPRRHYKIQEVIKRRQILLVQVVKEERGNKGAALTTYLSLAGRYSVLMPNTARGVGISRKITDVYDRNRLKSMADSFDVPQGMGLILRTAGASRTQQEIERDFQYLIRIWENVRTLTLSSTAPCLIYEEGSLIKRSIRDLYDKDTSEILVSGDLGFREAKNFMAMVMPDNTNRVKLYHESAPMFTKLGVEGQLDSMMQPQVNLKSGGYLVINQTEALVAIDVNSGRSTQKNSVDETAYQTNLEAADEVARQLRLRDLSGLIVIDFIDMEEKRNNRSVEKRLKDALKRDRARIQVGRISHFGLLEMSRQRMRASVLESTTQPCPTCDGIGHIKAVSSVVLQVLRSIEEQLNKGTRSELIVRIMPETALYILNNKRESLGDLETRFGVRISIETDATLGALDCQIERGVTSHRREEDIEIVVQPDTIRSNIVIESDEGIHKEEFSEDKKRRKRRRKKRDSENHRKEDQTELQEGIVGKEPNINIPMNQRSIKDRVQQKRVDSVTTEMIANEPIE